MKFFPHFLIVILSLLCTSSIAVNKPKARILTQEELSDLLTAHNSARKKLKIAPLTFDDKLMEEAKKLAYKCAKLNRLQHSSSPYGENLYYSSFKSTPQEVVDSWLEEEKYFSHRKRIPPQKAMHYSQVIWKNTTQLGVACYKRGDTEFWACVYNPAGNVRGQKAY